MLDDFDYTAHRSITKAQIRELEGLGWLRDGRPLVPIGQTGVGKSFIAQAIALQVCHQGKSSLYTNVTTWLENVAPARSSGTYLRNRDKLATPDLFVLDGVGMHKLTATEAHDLCKFLEERSIGNSTVLTTQLPLDHCFESIADAVIAVASREGLQHTALSITSSGESYRGVKARTLAGRTKDS